ncbi:MAG TPA: nucleoside-diphosphate kinase [Clostridia bacterium]|jgi:nucleoside-diphosphate kinase|nr:nucleoside-diphosphate kinase [Clostridia bacterium]
MERSLVLVKPDGVKRGLIGEVLKRIEQKGLSIVELKMMQLTKEQAQAHYAEHKDKAFFPELIDFITSGKIVALIVEGENAVSLVRKLVGATDPAKAEPGSIRGDYANSVQENVVHASDSQESAEREIKIFFPYLY